tara:strand:+ start:43 stop:519 length:477 start_codon:yes stop_codon:yes gene_type:complete
MKKTYSIHVNSNEGVNVDALGAVKKFKFDWSIIPAGEYEMTFTFQSALLKLSHADALLETYPTQIFLRIPFIQCKYAVNSEGTAGSSTLLGLLEPKDGHKGSGDIMRCLVAGASFNAPTYLYGKPQGSEFEVSLRTPTGTANPVADTYDLVINLKHLC